VAVDAIGLGLILPHEVHDFVFPVPTFSPSHIAVIVPTDFPTNPRVLSAMRVFPPRHCTRRGSLPVTKKGGRSRASNALKNR
jgi:hypothetical protein